MVLCLDPETAEILHFLDPEIVKMDKKYLDPENIEMVWFLDPKTSEKLQCLDPEIVKMGQTFLDPEIIKMVRFLDLEIVEMVDKSCITNWLLDKIPL